MSASLVDRIAHLNRWRNRPLLEKALLSVGMLCLAVALPPFPGAPLVAVEMIFVTLVVARVPAKVWAGYVAAPVGFMLTGAAALLLQFDANGIGLYAAGLPLAAAVVARSFAAVCCLCLLSTTTPTTDLLAGLRRLGIPRELVDIAFLMYRFVFLLADVAIAMNNAQAARLGHSTARRRMKSLGLLLANLLPRAIDQAHRMEIGLAARGWDGQMPTLRLQPAASNGALLVIALVEAGTAALGIGLS